MNPKGDALRSLAREISQAMHCEYDAPRLHCEIDHWGVGAMPNRVPGYFGVGKVVFLLERPSTPSRGPGKESWRLRHFYGLIEGRFPDAHITDLVKMPGNVPATSDELERSWSFFMRELDIIDPLVVIAVPRAFDALGRKLDRLVPLLRIKHFADYAHPPTLETEFARLDAALGRVA